MSCSKTWMNWFKDRRDEDIMADAMYYFGRLCVLPFFIILFSIGIIIKKIVLLLKNFIIQSDYAKVVRTPAERFQGLDKLGYDFDDKFVELPIGGGQTLPRVHYIDEGPRDAKETILCLHGEPSWSFLYRKVIKGLVKEGYRVIAPDFIGFGKSDKYTHIDAYSHFLHKLTLRLLLDHLQVKNLTLVCQDWGGLTGLDVVRECPHLFSRLVIMNTGLPEGEHSEISKLHTITPFVMWRVFADFFATWLPIWVVFRWPMPNISKEVLAAYEAPFPSSLYKGGCAKWPLMVPLTPNFIVAADMKAANDFLKNEWKKPVLVMFSDNDPITKKEKQKFLDMLPQSREVVIHGGHHFLQEEHGEELAVNVDKFIKNQL